MVKWFIHFSRHYVFSKKRSMMSKISMKRTIKMYLSAKDNDYENDYMLIANMSDLYVAIRHPTELKVGQMISSGVDPENDVIKNIFFEATELFASYFRKGVRFRMISCYPNRKWTQGVSKIWEKNALDEIKVGNILKNGYNCNLVLSFDMSERAKANHLQVIPSNSKAGLFSIVYKKDNLENKHLSDIPPSDDPNFLVEKAIALQGFDRSVARNDFSHSYEKSPTKTIGKKSSIKKVNVSEKVADVLRKAKIEGDRVFLLDQLDYETYQEVNKILKAIGGKWNKKDKANVFPLDPAQAIADAINNGQAVNRQQTIQLFETPLELAERLVANVKLSGREHVLEPSAGRGAIAEVILKHLGADGHLTLVEMDPDNVNHLKKTFEHDQRVTIIQEDFLKYRPGTNVFDAIVMNPPFTRNQDIFHVSHAMTTLKPGGRLSAITSPSWCFGKNTNQVAFSQMMEKLSADIEVVPAGLFKKSGTSIETRMISFSLPKMEVMQEENIEPYM